MMILDGACETGGDAVDLDANSLICCVTVVTYTRCCVSVHNKIRRASKVSRMLCAAVKNNGPDINMK